MPNDLVPIDVEGGEVGWSRSAGVDQWAVVYANIVSGSNAMGTSEQSNSDTQIACCVTP